MKRFRAEGDFLLRALVNLVSCNRSQIHQLERALTDFEKLAEQHELPREIRQALHQAMRRRAGNGLSEDQLRARLDKLKELQILPEHRAEPGPVSDGETQP
jgi:succinate dehydrogenase/fumarate reductase flavoprotein subunit